MRNYTTLKTIVLIACFFSGLYPIYAQGFSDETATAGIVVDHDGDDYGELMAIGSGGAWLDVNSDGYLDCYITMRLEANKLYINNGDGTFTENAAAYGLEDATGDGAGVAVADFDNDGFQDIYLANGGTDRFFKNMNGSFTDITAAAGFDTTDDSRGTSASWGDYDGDGYLDLYVTNHNHKPSPVNSSTADHLYHNNGDGTFTDVSSLLSATGIISGFGFIGSWTDYDNDGDADLILINDCLTPTTIPNQIFRNDGGTNGISDWTFTEVGGTIGAAQCENGMGIAVGDPNHDGWMDFYFSNVGEAVYLQNNNGSFTDATGTANVGGQVWPLYSWGTSFLDYDLDGWQDLLITLGSLRFPYTTDPHPDMLFHNTGNGTFTDVSTAMGMDEAARGRHSLCADYDNDGDPDVLILMYGEPAKLKRNNNNNGNNYVKFNLVGTTSNRDGIGARLKLTTPGMVQYFETRSGSNLGGGEPTGAYFGLGTAASITELQITWPSGAIQTITSGLGVNQTHTIVEAADPVADLSEGFMDVAATLGIVGSCGLGCGHGSGVSFADFNGDGWDDLTFATENGNDILFYENNGGTFNQIATPVVETNKSESVIWVDFDNDGDKDFYVTNRDAPNRLYRNDGNLNMTDITVAAGLPLQNDPSYGAVFGDYDRDGWLDIYVTNWSFQNTYTNYLYRNNGDGTFTDVTASTGTSDGHKLSFCSAFFDYNNDGWQDIYIAQDRYIGGNTNTLFKNNGDETFSDVSAASGTNILIDAMNVGVGDYDNDGDQDIYVTNTLLGNELLRNNGDETFTDVASQWGVSFDKVSWGANFFDYDNDLDLDLYVSGMHMGSDKSSEFYLNDLANQTFVETNFGGMSMDTMNSFANAVGDFNNDGKVDIAVNNATPIGQPITNYFHLWQNMATNPGNYIKINLEGVVSNRQGVGCWVEFYINGNKYVRYKHCGQAYLGQNGDAIHMGLGAHTVVDEIQVHWLSGAVNVYQNVPVNQTITVIEDTSVLPIEWQDFSLTVRDKHTVDLAWTTAAEFESQGFEIQRSTNGFPYENIGWKSSTNRGNQVANYSFADETVEPGNQYYYRIKQFDFDGKFSYSKILSAQIDPADFITVNNFYPNPSSSGATKIEISLPNAMPMQVTIFQINGQQIANYSQDLDKGIQHIQLDSQPLESGIYFVKMLLKDEVFIRKIIVKK